jgi:ssDNA thymidine ADP-ribosyltransferase, DarT
MQSIDYLSGSVFHMVHFDNLQSIFQRRALLSKERVTQELIQYQSIAFDRVQNLRGRIFIRDYSNKTFRSLHSYVPFYFATHTPMLFVQYNKGIQNEIVFFEISRSILKNLGVLFTDGNATNQQLSVNKGEIVNIFPVTISQKTCLRSYRPDGPHGSNTDISSFYADITFLEELDWNAINGKSYVWGERKRMRQAELLVPDGLPLGRIRGISVNTQSMAQTVNILIAKCGLKGRIPSAICKPNLYIQ